MFTAGRLATFVEDRSLTGRAAVNLNAFKGD
jgi:hypothetical protein